MSTCGAAPDSMRRTCVCETPIDLPSWRVLIPAAILAERSSRPIRASRFLARREPRAAVDSHVGTRASLVRGPCQSLNRAWNIPMFRSNDERLIGAIHRARTIPWTVT